MNRRLLTTGLLAATLVLTAGCSANDTGTGAAPAPSATPVATSPAVTTSPAPTATVSAEPEAAIATLALGGTAITALSAGGETLGSAAFTDGPEAMVAFLTDAVGTDPQVTTTGTSDSDCTGPATVYNWDDALSLVDLETETPPLYVWTVSTRSAQTANGITLASSTGFSVGDDGTGLVQSLPAEQTINEGDSLSGPIIFDLAGTSDDGRPFGGAALVSTEGPISAITVPGTLSSYYC